MRPPASVYYTDSQFEQALKKAKVKSQEEADLRAWRNEWRYRLARLFRTRTARSCQKLYDEFLS